ncbi:MAG: aminopeptidase P family protein [Candidatus Omnitrophica bacterium]|nr:aminopeptidase P family protein [Candidatus Omnitrophota bacterium]
MNNTKNIKLVRAYLKQIRAEAFLITSEPNVRYLSGFRGNDCCLLLTAREKIFLADFRYKSQAQKEICPDFKIIMVENSRYEVIKNLVKQRNIKTLCFESSALTVEQFDKLKNILGKNAKLFPTKNVVEKLRLLKSPEEIKLIKKAVSITKKSLRLLKPFIKPGVSEVFLRNKLEQFLKDCGAQRAAFDIIVASGPNAAMPHAQTTKRKIKPNEPIIIDVGAEFNGYKSDLTRTFFSGKITPYIKYYKLIGNAQHAAIKLVRPHVMICELDKAAREYLGKKGLAQYFGHALGHGVGLQVHEAPSISVKNNEKLLAGMVFTVEPGIYITGNGGIRIEDMIMVTKKGYEVL